MSSVDLVVCVPGGVPESEETGWGDDGIVWESDENHDAEEDEGEEGSQG